MFSKTICACVQPPLHFKEISKSMLFSSEICHVSDSCVIFYSNPVRDLNLHVSACFITFNDK